MIKSQHLFSAASLSLLLLSALPGRAQSPVPSVPELASADYVLVFDDEFDGDSLDTTKWDYRTDSKGLSAQLPANVTVSGGFLHLNLRKEPTGDKDYSGAGIISKQTFRYGYYEARLRIPPGSGWHTSFWMQHYDGKGTSPSQAEQELDVVENDSSHPRAYSCGVHKWKGGHQHWGKNVQSPDSGLDEFHVYGCDYTPEAVRYYLDGKLVETVDVSTFEQNEQNIWLTSIGYGNVIDDSKLPATADFDYVRYFAKPNSPAK